MRGLVGHDSGERRVDPGVGKIELGGFQRSFRLFDERAVVARVIGVVHFRAKRGLGLGELMVGERGVGGCDAQRSLRLIVIFRGNDALRLERLGAIPVDFGLIELARGQADARLGRGHARVHFVHRLMSAGKLRARLIDTDLVVARVESKQQFAFGNRPVIFDVQIGHGSGDARGNQRDSAIDVGVIGRDMAFEITVIVERGEDRGDNRNDHDHQQNAAQ
jgi:hypothetical protein